MAGGRVVVVMERVPQLGGGRVQAVAHAVDGRLAQLAPPPVVVVVVAGEVEGPPVSKLVRQKLVAKYFGLLGDSLASCRMSREECGRWRRNGRGGALKT